MRKFFFNCLFVSELQGRASPLPYTLQRYSDHPSTSFNSYYNSHYPQFSSPNTNASAYEYNYTNSCMTDSQASQNFGSGSHHLTYTAISGSNSMHNASPAQYSSARHTTPYINSHYVNANYVQPMQSQVQPKTLPQSLVFPELDHLSNDELKKLAEDEDSMDDFLETHTQLKHLNLSIDESIDSVEEIAGTYNSRNDYIR